MPLPEIIDLPPSASQRELWLAQEFGTESQGNNVAELFSIEGKLDEDLFRRALEHAFREVESLQVQFLRRNGAILQQLDPSAVLNYAVIDLRSESSARLAMLEWISQDLRQHVDLTVGRLHTIALFRLSDTTYAWYVRAHHIIIDGFSGMLWAHRVADVYTAFVNGDAPSPSPFASLRALLSGEESYLSSEQLQRDRAFWIAEMAGAPDGATLASRKAAPSSRCIREQIGLSPQTEAQLRQLARESGVEISSLLFAFVAVYLARMEGLDEIVVGLPVTGRVGRLARKVPCALSNVLPLRVMIDSEQSVVDLAQQVGRNVRRLLRHQRYRYEDCDVISALSPKESRYFA